MTPESVGSAGQDRIPDTAAPLAALLEAAGVDLTEWQANWLDDIYEHAAKGDRLVYRFLGRKIGYGWAWEPCEVTGIHKDPVTGGSRA